VIRPRTVVVTKSLSKKELQDSRLLENAVAIMDIQESCIFRDDGKPEKIISEILSMGAKTVAITLGKNGVIFYNPQTKRIRKDSLEREKEQEIQDHMKIYGSQKTGAGDYFASALTYHLGEGVPLEEAVTKAQVFVVKNLIRFKDVSEKDYSQNNFPN